MPTSAVDHATTSLTTHYFECEESVKKKVQNKQPMNKRFQSFSRVEFNRIQLKLM